MVVELTAPSLGIPSGVKEKKISFRDKEFDLLAETRGVRIAWSRAMACPCVGVNNQTDQPDPNCDLCKNTPGFIFFRPTDYAAVEAKVGTLTTLQDYIVERDSSPAVLIKGVIQKNIQRENSYDRIGPWEEGGMFISTRKENILGHYDRLVVIDSVMSYSQIAFRPAKVTDLLKLRFPAVSINLLRDVSKVYLPKIDYNLTELGDIQFVTGKGPAGGGKLAVHYTHHPQLIVMDHPHAFRATLDQRKISLNKKVTPEGNPQILPVQAVAQLEFLVRRD